MVTYETFLHTDISVDIKNHDSEGADRDSGIGQSHHGVSGQLFALSHFSGGTVISIPDGRESRYIFNCNVAGYQQVW